MRLLISFAISFAVSTCVLKYQVPLGSLEVHEFFSSLTIFIPQKGKGKVKNYSIIIHIFVIHLSAETIQTMAIAVLNSNKKIEGN
jgi:hypothetical protein